MYDPKSARFFIELPEDEDPWMLPPPLDSYAKRGIYSVFSDKAAGWIEQRIIPRDRQNLGMILKENGLKSYDPYRLLVLADGRCAQDDCFIVPVGQETLPAAVWRRLQEKVLDVIPLKGSRVIVCFRNGTCRLIDLSDMIQKDKRFLKIASDEALFMRVHVSPLGNGIEWDDVRYITAQDLYRAGEKLPLTSEDFLQYTRYRVLDTAGMAKKMHCSRQYIKQLTDERKLHPLQTGLNHLLFPARETE